MTFISLKKVISNNPANANLFNLVLSSNNAPEIDINKNAVLHYNNATFNYTNASLVDNYHVKISSGGSLYKDACYGLKKIAISFTNDSNSLNIRTAYNQETLTSGRYDYIYSFATGDSLTDIKGDYFYIYFNEDTLIESLSLTYRCESQSNVEEISSNGSHVTVMTNPYKWYHYQEGDGEVYRTPIINDQGTIIADVKSANDTTTGNCTYLRYGLIDDTTTYTANVTISAAKPINNSLKVAVIPANGKTDKTITLTSESPSYTYTTSSFTPTVTRDSEGKVTGGKAFQIKIYNAGLYYVSVSFNKPVEPGLTEAYFDSNYIGVSEGTIDKPFKDINEIKSLNLNTCRSIYLKCNSVFNAPLDFNDLTGSSDNPYLLTSYGTGEKPIIKGNNITNDALIDVVNCSYFTIDGLELYDTAISEGDRRAVRFIANGDNESETIYSYYNNKITNCYIHDIKGILDAENKGMSIASKCTGGIHVSTGDCKGRFVNLDISYNTIENVDNCGIASWRNINVSSSETKEVETVYPADENFNDIAHLNMHIHHNNVSNIGKNAIFSRYSKDCVIEYNVVHDTAYRCYAGNQIVTAFSKGTIVQHNEGYNNNAHPLASGSIQDGAFLDADVYSMGTIWQYNYSHDNTFGLFINCTKNDEHGQDDVIVRFNVSVNDLGSYSGTTNRGIFTFNYDAYSLEVYNNTILTGENTKSIMGTTSNIDHYHFYNNIVYNRSDNAEFRITTGYDNVSFHNNLVFNATNNDITNLSSFTSYDTRYFSFDPLFVGSLPSEATLGIDSVTYLKLSESSLCKNKASAIPSTCTSDYFGLNPNKTIGFSCNI